MNKQESYSEYPLKIIPVKEFKEFENNITTGQVTVFRGVPFSLSYLEFINNSDKDFLSEGQIFTGATFFVECHELTSIPANTVFKKSVTFNNCSCLETISEGVIFEDDVLFYDCENIKNISDSVVFNGGLEFATSKRLVLRKKHFNENEISIESHILEPSVSEEMKTSLVKMKQDGRIKGKLYL